MRRLLYSLVGLSFSLLSMAQLPMHGWKLHTAYNNVTRVEMAGNRIYALSEGALFSVDTEDLTVDYYNRLTGLSSSNITDIHYDSSRDMLIIAYANGYIDLLKDDEVTTISDLYGASISDSKEVNHIFVHQNKAYLSMDFGIIELNLQRTEIANTYYIGENAAAVNVTATTVIGDSIFAAVGNQIYAGSLKDDLVDFSYWKVRGKAPVTGDIQHLVAFENQLYMTIGGNVYVDQNGWAKVDLNGDKIVRIRVSGGRLLAMSEASGTWMIDAQQVATLCGAYTGAPDAVYDNYTNAGWFAYYDAGVGYFNLGSEQIASYLPSGPITNTAYRMRFQGERLYVVPGGYLGVPYNREGCIMWYENGTWMNYTTQSLRDSLQHEKVIDFCDIIASPTDPNHFYVASYSNGLLEFRDNKFYACYDASNSGLESRIENNPRSYTRVDALAFDNDGNLWMQNCSQSSTRVFTVDSNWYAFNNVSNLDYKIPKTLLLDNQNPNQKIFINAYNTPFLSILDDNGTIAQQSDDKIAGWNSFIDEDGNTLMPDYMYCAAQDKHGAIWVGTKTGVLRFVNPSSLLTSNACSRIKIAREDGSGLADYMLGNEQVNAIAVDGANRIWFGTETSGAYLMDLSDPQNVITIHHYTTDNSPLPSNTILSIAINPITGEVFFGTGGGLASYQSDAAEGKDDYTGAYAYPNPVRENFDGVITIAGLMEDTQVRITDNGGNLVYETKSNGGLAIWDGKNGRGDRVSSGVYFAMCVTADGANKTLVKILVMN